MFYQQLPDISKASATAGTAATRNEAHAQYQEPHNPIESCFISYFWRKIFSFDWMSLTQLVQIKHVDIVSICFLGAELVTKTDSGSVFN